MDKSLSQSKRTNQLMTQENSLDNFFLTVINGLIILDENFNYLYVNEDCAEIAGINSNEFIGKNIWRKYPKLVGTIFEKNTKEAMVKRRINRFEWISAYGNIVIFTVIPSDEGLLISGEIPEKSEEILASDEEKYQYIVKYAPAGICEVDYDSLEFKRVNNSLCQTTKYSEHELLSMTILDILAPAEVTKFRIRIKGDLFSSCFFDDSEYRILTKDGENCWINFNSRVTYENKKPAGLLLVCHDVTENKNKQAKLETQKKRLEKLVEIKNQQLQEQQRLAAIGQTANMVGHDIRNPLQAIMSSVYLIREDIALLQDNQEKRDIFGELDDVENQIAYIDKIIKDLQFYGKPIVPELIETDLKAIIQSIADSSIPKNVTFVLQTSELPKVKIDPLLFKRSMNNLVSNALQAMPNGGTLAIKAWTKENLIVITVEDDGLGIPEENKNKIFTPLFTTKSKGQGLGLAVVKRLIDAHKGEISFESEQGKGTKFTITLPIQ